MIAGECLGKPLIQPLGGAAARHIGQERCGLAEVDDERNGAELLAACIEMAGRRRAHTVFRERLEQFPVLCSIGVDEDLVGGRVATQHQHHRAVVVLDHRLGQQPAVPASHHLVRTHLHVAPRRLLLREERSQQFGHH